MRQPDLGSLFKILMIVVLATMQSACWSFYAVRSTFSVSEAPAQAADVTETELYRNMIDSVERIAVKAPDGCANETSSQSKGEAKSREGVLLKSNCGQEMALLERALVNAKYKVVSWSVVNSRSKANNRAPLDIAKEMDADFLLQVNSMERLTTSAGASLQWERRFFRSDSRWNIYNLVRVNSRTRTQIVRHAKDAEGRIQPGRISVSLNATVTDVENGEAIWFYEWTLSEAFSDNVVESVSFSACSLKNGLCKPWPPRLKERGQGEYSSGISGIVEIESPVEDRRRARHNELMKRLVKNMIDSLKNPSSPEARVGE